jgi:hypothetical protein
VTPRVSGRLVRSFLRSLRARVGESAYQETTRGFAPADLAPARADFIPLDEWLPILTAFEQRYGDLSSLQLIRETTRATMALLVQKGWAASGATVTREGLLARADELWHMSYDTGHLTVTDRGVRHVQIEIQGWPDVPAIVVASMAEACVVFLVGLGERAARAVEQGRGVEVSW